MMPSLSPDTKAILLLCAPLIAGRGAVSPDLLSPLEFNRLARHLREIQRRPADIFSSDAAELLCAKGQPILDENRLKRLLGRGYLLSQVMEHWQSRAIWVLGIFDANYPQRLKARLPEHAPAILYGCGEIGLLRTGGLALVGSGQVNDALINQAMDIGCLAARAGKMIVSGGATGIDQAAMRGGLEAGGNACGILSDSLEKAVMLREHRNLLMDKKLLLISPFDPKAGFNAGNAMQRNKLIYALADAALVLSADFNKGETWAGATEQLNDFQMIPVYVRSTAEHTKALEALQKMGAFPWPDPQNADEFEAVFERATTTSPAPQVEEGLVENQPKAAGQMVKQPRLID